MVSPADQYALRLRRKVQQHDIESIGIKARPGDGEQHVAAVGQEFGPDVSLAACRVGRRQRLDLAASSRNQSQSARSARGEHDLAVRTPSSAERTAGAGKSILHKRHWWPASDRD